MAETEKLLCIVTPEARTYYKATCIAQEFLDKDNNVVHKIGKIPDGEITEITTATATIKHFEEGKLNGKLEVINLQDRSITFSEEYEHGQLVHVSEHTAPIPKTAQPKQQTPANIYTGTILKTTPNGRAFFVDGNQIAEETLADNGACVELLGQIPDGLVKEFTESGNLKTEAHYAGNKLNGEMICYLEDGRVASKETFEQGVLNGPAEYYSYSSQNCLHTQCFYSNAQLDGDFTITQQNGIVRERALYNKGRLTGKRTTYYPNGSMEIQEKLTEGKITGERKVFFPTGELWYLETYTNGRLEGERKEFFQDGKTRMTEFYSDGMLNGQRDIYSSDGELIASEQYHWGNIIHNTEYRPI